MRAEVGTRGVPSKPCSYSKRYRIGSYVHDVLHADSSTDGVVEECQKCMITHEHASPSSVDLQIM